MVKVAKIGGVLVVLLVLAAGVFLGLSPSLRSDPDVGLSPSTHRFGAFNVRDFTAAPLGAEVKLFLPITPAESMEIVADLADYPNWVEPAPDPSTVSVDNSPRADGEFGVGSLLSYSANETDVVEYYDPGSALLVRPQWGLDNFSGHRGVVIAIPHEGGSIIHFRRYFEPSGMQGWLMSKMMPMFMEQSAENLAELRGGEVY